MKKQLFPFTRSVAASTFLLLAACGNDKTAEADAPPGTINPADSLAAQAGDSARMAKPEGVLVDGIAMTADRNIVENAALAPSVSQLVGAVKQAGLAETLAGPGPFTVFAPNNAAFDKLPKGAMAGLLRLESQKKLQGLLTYHVIPGRLLAADFRDGQELSTVNGEKLKITVRDSKVLISNGKDAPATVQVADVISKNGVTHIVDGVILPLQ